MNYSQHLFNCFSIELTGALINLANGTLVAWWILFGLSVATGIAGFIVYRKEKKREQSLK